MPCSDILAEVCAGQRSRAISTSDALTMARARASRPPRGLGCNAGGYARCRFCEFGQYEDIRCPTPKISLETELDTTIEDFREDADQFGIRLATAVTPEGSRSRMSQGR